MGWEDSQEGDITARLGQYILKVFFECVQIAANDPCLMRVLFTMRPGPDARDAS